MLTPTENSNNLFRHQTYRRCDGQMKVEKKSGWMKFWLWNPNPKVGLKPAARQTARVENLRPSKPHPQTDEVTV